MTNISALALGKDIPSCVIRAQEICNSLDHDMILSAKLALGIAIAFFFWIMMEDWIFKSTENPEVLKKVSRYIWFFTLLYMLAKILRLALVIGQ